MENKTLRIEVKDAEQGQIEAVFSTFNKIDHDGDVTLPGAFEDGAAVRISAYGHSSWMGALPVGKGTIKTTKDDARLVGQFFMDTPHGRDTFSTVKGLGDLAEFSYGFDVQGTGSPEDLPEELQGAERVLTKLKVHEVSPVLLGAGIDTRLVTAKGGQLLLLDEQKNEVEPKQPDPELAVALKTMERTYLRFLRTRFRLLGV